jgi:hypothetical protein
MSETNLRQTAKIASLEAARGLFFMVAALAVRESLLFARGADISIQPEVPLYIRILITSGFLLTLFRYSHGVALVYELEKKIAQASTTPSLKRVETIFILFSLEAIALFLMSDSLGQPKIFVEFVAVMLLCDWLYIWASKVIRNSTMVDLSNPLFWRRRWRWTVNGTETRTHLQWAISDVVLGGVLLATLLNRPTTTRALTTGNMRDDWIFSLAALLVFATFADYALNREFYFGGARAEGRKLVFVSNSQVEAAPEVGGGQPAYENIRRAQWYCRGLHLEGKIVPFAPIAFYTYFLHDNDLDRTLGRKAALEFLDQCDAIYFYTPNASENLSHLTTDMQEELRRAKEKGLDIKFQKASNPPENFQPVWAALAPPNEKEDKGEAVDLEKPGKRVFICSALREGKTDDAELTEAIKKNVRLAQWLCHELIRTNVNGDEIQVPIAPHAFYPYFTDFKENSGVQWLESGLDVLKVCDVIHVYTSDGLENKKDISEGMQLCIRRARALGIELKFQKAPPPDPKWQPKEWVPVGSE